MIRRKFNSGDMLYFSSLGMFLCCVGFWFCGAKDLANQLIVGVVLIGLGGMVLSKTEEIMEK